MQEIGVIAACLAAGAYIAFRIRRSIRARNECRCDGCTVNDCDRRG